MPSPRPSWSIAPPPTSRRNKTLNAYTPVRLQTDPAHETAAERTTRYLRTCQELIELGMTLARAAAEHAMQDMAAPPPGTPIPGSAAGALEQAEARARQRTPNYGAVFARIARAVRQTVALQAHIAAGTLARQPAASHAPPHAPPHAMSTPKLSAPAETTHPDRPDHVRDEADRPDWLLPRDPNGQVPIENLLLTFRDELSLEPHADSTGQCETVAPARHCSAAPAASGQHERAPQTLSASWRPPAGRKRSG